MGLRGADDPAILAWAAEQPDILLKHDRATVPDFAFERVTAGQSMPGVFIVNDRLAPRQTIDELLFLDEYSEQVEWAGMVLYLPL